MRSATISQFNGLTGRQKYFKLRTPIDRTISLVGYNEYIRAIHMGVEQHYDMIQKIFLDLLKVT